MHFLEKNLGELSEIIFAGIPDGISEDISDGTAVAISKKKSSATLGRIGEATSADFFKFLNKKLHGKTFENIRRNF